MFTVSRRRLPHSDYWSLFDWFGRSCDQTAGVLLNPLVIAIYARSVEDDLVRLSYMLTGFGVAWLLGATLGPLLQRLTVRVMPWIVGGFTVRTASAALLAYSAADRSSPSDQRFRSALICTIAYAAATGIARSAEAHHLRSRPGLESPYLRSILGTMGAAAITAIGAWAMWSVLSTESLSWSRGFGRIWTLAAIALGVASLAAIIRGSSNPEIPADRDHLSSNRVRGRIVRRPIAGLLSVGLGIVLTMETIALLAIFVDFRRDSLIVRSSLALFAAGWVVGIPMARAGLERFASAILLQISIGCGAIGMVAALSLRDVAGTDWFPDSVRGYDSVKIAIYAIAFLFGLAGALRRTSMAAIASPDNSLVGILPVLIGLVAALSPTVYAAATQSLSFDWLLIVGIAVSMLSLILAGGVETGSSFRRSRSTAVNQSFAPSFRR